MKANYAKYYEKSTLPEKQNLTMVSENLKKTLGYKRNVFEQSICF